MASTFETMMRSKGISPDSIYTIKEIAGIMDVSQKTVRTWSTVGRRSRKYGILTLKTYSLKGSLEIHGSDLIEYLRKCNGDR